MSAARKKAAMQEKISKLERENEAMRSRLSMMEVQEASTEPLREMQQLHSLDAKLEFNSGVNQLRSDIINYAFCSPLEFNSGVNQLRSDIINVKGVECGLVVERIPRKDGRSGSEGFYVTVCVKNVGAMDKAHVQASVTLDEVDHYRSHSFNTNAYDYFMLYKNNVEEFGMKRKHINSDYNTSTTVQYRLTIGVHPVTVPEVNDDELVTVIVHGKEFSVNSSYLSQWSDYFRAYFNVNMKEKKEGIFPIADSDITAEDFEEVLMVIYPTDKPITTYNYKMLLRLANRFEMSQLTRRVERFLLDFERNGLSRAAVFRIATDKYDLRMVQATLLERWKDASVLREELLNTSEYEKLTGATKILINQRFAQASISKNGDERAEASDDEMSAGLVFDVSDEEEFYLPGS